MFITGFAAEIKVEELPGKVFTGHVTRIGWALDEATKTMPVEIELNNPEGILRPGMFAVARISVSQKPDVSLLPAEALVLEKAKTSVFVLDGTKAKKVPIKVGIEDGKFFGVVDGLTPDATVILTGKLPLTDGQPVARMEAK